MPTPPRTITSHSAAWTMLLVVTTRIAAKIITAASRRRRRCSRGRRTSCVAGADRAEHADQRGTFLTLASEPDSYASKSGTVVHPLTETLLVVEQVLDPHLGVLVLGAPEQRLERADLDADAAVHAERVVDVEAVEGVDLTGLAAGAARRRQRLVGLDVDAPVRALAGAQHARGAVLLLERDHATGPGRRGLLLARVLHGCRALGRRRRLERPVGEHRLHRRSGSVTPRPFRTPGTLGLGGIREPP